MPFSTSLRVRLTGALVAAAVVFTGAAAAAWTGPAASAADMAESGGSSSSATEAERRGREALQSLHYPWRDLGYTVEFRTYQGGTLGTANSKTKKIVVYVRASHSRQVLRTTIAHELGHALDFEYATVERRRDYRSIRKLNQSTRWYPCNGCSDYDSHAGDWAEVFAVWLAGPGDFRSNVAPAPSKEQLRRLAPLFQIPKAQSVAQREPTPAPKPSTTPSPTPSPLVPGVPLPTSGP